MRSGCLLGKHFPAELQIEKELVNLCDCATRFVFKTDCAARLIFKMIGLHILGLESWLFWQQE